MLGALVTAKALVSLTIEFFSAPAAATHTEEN
jgi:hypothetical protein